MSNIQINNLTFGYENSSENIFNNVTLNIDTDWKLGLIGRNGKGKTTLLNLLLNKYEYSGTILKSVEFDYFPFDIKGKEKMTIEIIQDIIPNIQDWEIMKELNLLKVDLDVLYRPFSTLSGGEQIKIMLATLFLKNNNFLLIDEPTNHLDIESRNNIQEYLKSKHGFILVSHDRELLDSVVDHILAINNTNIDIQKGNYSSWKQNKDMQDNFEITQNEKLKSEINRLEKTVKQKEDWSNKIESSKYNTKDSGLRPDRGYIGHKSAKMMQRAKSIELRHNKAIEEKEGLLKDIDRIDSLTIKPLEYEKEILLWFKDFCIKYGDDIVCSKVNFEVKRGERVNIYGKNGSGKSSILKLIIGDKIQYTGNFSIGNNLKVSYVSQTTDNLKGTLRDLAKEYDVDEGVFKAMLSKLGVSSKQFSRNIEEFSEGQKKKVLIAKSITESADLYIWDEPLNYIDIDSRIQIEEAILKYMPTMIFVEHDKTFVDKIATKKVELNKT